MTDTYPTTFDLVLQACIGVVGLILFGFVAWKNFQDRDRLREVRRCVRLQERGALLALFEERWPEGSGDEESGSSGGEGTDREAGDSSDGSGAAPRSGGPAAPRQQPAEGAGIAAAGRTERRPLCAVCLQPLRCAPAATAGADSAAAAQAAEEATPVLRGADAAGGGGAGGGCARRGRTVIRFACPGAHLFHRKCIKAWVVRGRSTCPICKFDLHDLGADGASGVEVVTPQDEAEATGL